MSDLFISYGHADASAFAERLKSDLQAAGYTVWWDKEGIRSGQAWDARIEGAIEECSVLLAVLTPGSVRKDSICRDEITYAMVLPRAVVAAKAAEEVRPTLALVRRSWVDFTQDYHDGLRRLLAYLDGSKEALLPPSLEALGGIEPLDFSRRLAELTRRFTGREWLALEVDRWLAHSAKRAFVVVGEPGIGKSAIAAWVATSRDERVAAVHFCDNQDRRTLDPHRFVASVVAQLHGRMPEYAERVDGLCPGQRRETAGQAFVELVVEPAHRLAAPRWPQLIVVDSLDEASTAVGETILDVICEHAPALPDWLRVLTTTRPEPAVIDRIRALQCFELEANRRENQEDLQRYVGARVAEIARKLGCVRSAVAAQVERASDGNFLVAKLLLDALAEGDVAADELPAVSPGLGYFYGRFCRSRFPDPLTFDGRYRPLVATLAASQEPLGLPTVAAALECRHPEALVRLRGIGQLVRERDGRYSLFHKYLVDWVTDSAQAGAHWCPAALGHELLARALWQEFAGDPQRLSAYGEAHLATHLAELQWWWHLAALVASARPGLVSRWVEQGDDLGLRILTRLVEEGGLEPVHQAALATQVARIHTQRAEYRAAEDWLGYAIARTSWRRGRRARAVAFHELGNLHLYRQDWASARAAYRRALRLCTWGVPMYRDEAAGNRLALAALAARPYRWAEVARLARRARREAWAAGAVEYALAAERHLAFALEELGKFEEAQDLLDRALEASDREGARLERARLLIIKGGHCYAQATLRGEGAAEAAGVLQRALDEAQELHDLYSVLDAKLCLGWCALAEGQTEEAQRYFGDVEAALPRGIHIELEVGVLAGLAATTHQRGDLEAAVGQYNEVIAAAQPIRAWGYEDRALVGLGAISWHAGNREEAERYSERARDCAARHSPREQQLVAASIRLCQTAPSVVPR